MKDNTNTELVRQLYRNGLYYALAAEGKARLLVGAVFQSRHFEGFVFVFGVKAFAVVRSIVLNPPDFAA